MNPDFIVFSFWNLNLMDYSRIERFDEVVPEPEAIVNAVRVRDLDAAKKALSRNVIR